MGKAMMAVSRTCLKWGPAWTLGLLAFPSIVGLFAGCQVMDVRPSAEIDMPRKLPQPAGLTEPNQGDSARENRSQAQSSESAAGTGSNRLPQGSADQLKQAAFNEPSATLPTERPANLGADSTGSQREKPVQVALAPRTISHNPVLAAAVPSDPPLPVPMEGSSRLDPLDTVYKRSFDWFQNTDSFTCRMIRREMVGGVRKPEELISFQYRKNPYSIHLKWLGEVGKGREVVYVEGKFDNKIQIRLAGGDMPFVAAGKRMSFNLDNPLVRSSSRHGVQEASFGFMLSTVGTMIAQQKQGNSKLGTVQYAGKVHRQELGMAVEMIEVKIFPGTEDGLPHGGRRLIGFNPQEGMPMLVQTFDDKGQEVEFYRYDLFICKGLDSIDFDPDALWGKPDLAVKSK